MSTHTCGATAALHEDVLAWYAVHQRDLPWRTAVTSAWAVLVSEVMLQQTPVIRVEPAWRAWMQRWPTPQALADADPADVLRMWGRLGYPRRALRLQAAARAVVRDHGGELPRTTPELRALPGVGEYTAAAVRAFAHGERDIVLDTNVRRVLARVLAGSALPAPTLTRAERGLAAGALPDDAATSAAWNVAVMELGALVCTVADPGCERCPVADRCRWRASGFPADVHADRRRKQRWHGTDRQARGRLLGALRDADGPLPEADLPHWGDEPQRDRALGTLIADGLISVEAKGDERDPRYRLGS